MSRRARNSPPAGGATPPRAHDAPPRGGTDEVRADRGDAVDGRAPGEAPPREPASRLVRALLVGLAILLPQLVLFWPSLSGERVLLPLDVLAVRTVWIAPGEPEHLDRATDEVYSDLAFVTEPNRRYTAEAVRSGRMPFWAPDAYCGAPYFAANHPAVFSPYRLVDYLVPGVAALGWSQLLKSLVAGVGAYLFARRVLRAAFVPALVGAAAFPLCGYMIAWQGFSLSQVASWLPWILWATHAAVRRPAGPGGIALACATCALLVSGHAANAGHVLVASALLAGWVAFEERARGARAVALGLASVLAGWVAGFALSAPQLLPTIEYMGQSVRIAARAAGEVETTAMGPGALWQVVFPFALGASRRGAISLTDTPWPESAAAAYAGFLALLACAPLAFADARARPRAWFFAGCGVFALVPLLGVPLVEAVFGWPPLSLLRNNRFTILTAFAILALAVLGLDALVRGRVRPGRWTWIPFGLCAALAAWSFASLANPPVVPEAIEELSFFRGVHRAGLLVSCAGAAWWFVVGRVLRAPEPARARLAPRLAWIVGLALVVELTVQAFGTNPQGERRLDYPRLAVLGEVERRDPERAYRTIGLNCLPPNLMRVHGLRDVRGYDAADPARIVELLRAQRDPDAPAEFPYAVTLTHVPRHPSGISDLLALRWIVVPGDPPPGVRVAFTGGGYSLFENTRAAPRATVPARVEVEPSKERRLARLVADDFDPRALALLEAPPPAPLPERAVGRATIVRDEPEHVALDLDLETDALVVLADAWDAGWSARVDGTPAPVLVVDHAVRGVVAPRGARRLEFEYEPRTWRLGLWIGALALGSICVWAFALARVRRATPIPPRPIA